MASASSSVAPVKVSEKQGRASQKSVQKYYKTEVTTLADGSVKSCLLYTSPSPRDATLSRMPSSA